MAERSARRQRPLEPGLIHLLNQRYHREWVRAELLSNELASMQRSKLWRILSWLRNCIPRRMPAVPTLLESARAYDPIATPFHQARVGIVIPFKDCPELLCNCLRSLNRSTFRRFDVVLVNNGSTEPRTLRLLARLQRRTRFRIVFAPGPFNFSRLCNLGAEQSRGDYLLFLNNDTEVLSRRWLEQMLSIAADPQVGIVGATLLYPDRTIQHVGVFPRSDGLWVHPYRGCAESETGERGELTAPRTVPAVTAACLLIRRTLFEDLDGFDERFPVAYNDVDLCDRVRQRGLLVAISPEARLIHYESLSRGCTLDASETRFTGGLESGSASSLGPRSF